MAARRRTRPTTFPGEGAHNDNGLCIYDLSLGLHFIWSACRGHEFRIPEGLLTRHRQWVLGTLHRCPLRNAEKTSMNGCGRRRSPR